MWSQISNPDFLMSTRWNLAILWTDLTTELSQFYFLPHTHTDWKDHDFCPSRSLHAEATLPCHNVCYMSQCHPALSQRMLYVTTYVICHNVTLPCHNVCYMSQCHPALSQRMLYITMSPCLVTAYVICHKATPPCLVTTYVICHNVTLPCHNVCYMSQRMLYVTMPPCLVTAYVICHNVTLPCHSVCYMSQCHPALSQRMLYVTKQLMQRHWSQQ